MLSYRQVSFFFSFYSFLFSYWIISKVLSSNSYILFFCLIHPAVSALYCIFLLLTELFSSRFCLLLFYDFYLFVKLLIFFMYCLLISLNCFLVYNWASLKQFFWILLFDELGISLSLSSVTRKLLWSFSVVMFPWFFYVP